MIVGKSSLDWLTLTSWDSKAMRRIGDDMLRMCGCKSEPSRSAKVMQYEGNLWVSQSIFMGVARQGANPHLMIRVSGEGADTVLPAVWANKSAVMARDVTATRIDVQLTLPSVSQDSEHIAMAYRSMAQAMREKVKGANPYGSRVTLIDGEDGECTLYVGSRQSERYTRIYQKKSEDGEVFTRLEVEVKGELAKSLLLMIAEGEDRAQEVMDSMVLKMVSQCGNANLMATFRQHVASVKMGALPTSKRKVSEESKTLEWLRTDVHSAVGKLAKSHEYRELTLDTLLAMLRQFE